MSPVDRFFHPVLASKALSVGPTRVRVAGRDYVLFRDRQGRPAAFVDRCPHRFAPLSAGRVRDDGRLECPYHGWNFDTEGKGVSPSQPTLKKCDATVMQLVERHGYLWLADPSVPLERFPEVQWDGYRPAGSFSMLFEAPLHVALDNFSEDEHTPWVHTRLGWDRAHVDTIEFEAENFDDRTEVVYRARQRRSPARFLIGIREGDTFHNEWVTRFDPVRTIYDIYWTDARSGKRRGVVTRSAIFMVPEEERRTRFHVFVTLKVEEPKMRLLAPIIKRAAVGLAWWEIRDDARFIGTVADTPEKMQGMRLGKYDKPLVHNHKLLRRLYWSEDDKVHKLTTVRGA